MGEQVFAIQMLVILAANYVTSFTITGRYDGDTDLAKAIAVLHRQRRRSTENYLNPNHLLNGGSLSVDDVRDWLKASNIQDESSNINSDVLEYSNPHFKDIDHLLRQNDLQDKTGLVFSSVKPSRQEMEDVFNSDNQSGSSSGGSSSDGSSSGESSLVHKALSDWLSKDKMADDEPVSINADKKSNSPKTVEDSAYVGDNLSLSTLTKEEFRALMKAIDKLRKQSEKFAEKTVETLDSKVAMKEILGNSQTPNSDTILQVVNEEEVNLPDHGAVSHGVMETEVVTENAPDVSEERALGQQITSKHVLKEAEATQQSEIDLVNELTSALADNVAAATENALREEIKHEFDDINNNRISNGRVNKHEIQKSQKKDSFVKRNNKRSVAVLPAFIKDLFDDEDGDDLMPPRLEKFVARIVQLQEEVDRLKLISRLEDLENDVLTDALNEATLGQDDDTVSGLEFDSLKEAINIEEALQDLRKSRISRHDPAGVIKRGKHWRRKRGLPLGRDSDLVKADTLQSLTWQGHSSRGQKATKEDMRRLLGQTYLMKDQESRESGPEQASFLLPGADKQRTTFHKS